MTSIQQSVLAESNTVRDIVEWDVRNWSRALPFWSARVGHTAGASALTIGERHGGSSLWCALHGMDVVATDLHGVTERGQACHLRYGVNDAIRYAHADVTKLPFDDDSFDVVLFKSVLGALETRERQIEATDEMHRVLRTGGKLLFAENLKGSALHQYTRDRFVPWARDWRYLDPAEDLDIFGRFGQLEVSYHGVAAAFGRTDRQRSVLGNVDSLLSPILPRRLKYIMFGVASKTQPDRHG